MCADKVWTHPCPFCGSEPEVDLRDGVNSKLNPAIVWCGNEDCVIWDLTMSLTEWNLRPVQANIEKALEDLLVAAELVLDWRYGASDRNNYRKRWVRALKSTIEKAFRALGRPAPER